MNAFRPLAALVLAMLAAVAAARAAEDDPGRAGLARPHV